MPVKKTAGQFFYLHLYWKPSDKVSASKLHQATDWPKTKTACRQMTVKLHYNKDSYENSCRQNCAGSIRECIQHVLSKKHFDLAHGIPEYLEH